jgi:ech hydrogenase subunit A
MTLPLVLILLPLFGGLLMLAARTNGLRAALVMTAVPAVAALTVLLAVRPDGWPAAGHLPFPKEYADHAMTAVEGLLAVYLLYVGVRARNPAITALVLAQAGVTIWAEGAAPAAAAHAAAPLVVDRLSALMALINGLVGGAICVYALGYMRGYHEEDHADVPDRRPLFFSLLLVFMGAMFGLVFANDLKWLLFFWELTTVCSFLLIGYPRTAPARRNARRALAMNLLGGLAFSLAVVACRARVGAEDLHSLVAAGQAVALLPAALLCFAGITKSAQLPFSSWLLGAMIAPTPVSALLHSSTMVKAGVYLVLRMAPAVAGTKVGLLVALVGGATFLFASLAAVTATDAKRVLAWSTVANLGLIVMCGGIGTAAAVWAGVLLILFHAVAKCLLFLCVGVAEHQLHTREIESMAGLIVRLPWLAVVMLVGMAAMFLAPFGMLVSKWAVLQAVVDAFPPLTVVIAFGSAATLFFWVKWMGKLIEVLDPGPALTRHVGRGERAALFALAAATLATCALFPWISSAVVEPFVLAQFGQAVSLGRGNAALISAMMTVVLLFPLTLLGYGRDAREVKPHLGGANLPGRPAGQFLGASGQVETARLANYTLREVLSEASLARWGAAAAALFLVLMMVIACR